jgi:hypothetical protein
MASPGWRRAENELFRGSRDIIRRFAREHADEAVSLFAFTIDSEFVVLRILDWPSL